MSDRTSASGYEVIILHLFLSLNINKTKGIIYKTKIRKQQVEERRLARNLQTQGMGGGIFASYVSNLELRRLQPEIPMGADTTTQPNLVFVTFLVSYL